MNGPAASEPASAPADIKQVPPEADVRAQLRRRASEIVRAEGWSQAPDRPFLERVGARLLEQLGLPPRFLGFAMVALNNAFWQEGFAAVPFSRRLLLLPHCFRDEDACRGAYDSDGLHCAGCGHCRIHELKTRAEALGYHVIVAEGTGAVTNEVLEEERDAVLGVACLDSLEKSFARVADLGLPHLAVPLLTNGCRRTQTDLAVVEALLALKSDHAAPVTRTYLPLLREAGRLFEDETLRQLLAPYLDLSAPEEDEPPAFTLTERLALEWLKEGGKRLRPFVTLAAYAVARHGGAALSSQAALDELLPLPVRRLALAIEILHKASLVHDDIEDDGEFRYGRPALHRVHGVATALNAGDYLVGLGYRLVAGENRSLGDACTAEILKHLTSAHLALCRGQGAELALRRDGICRPRDVLAIGALKTAPAFEVALFAGLRAAEVVLDPARLKRFANYVGEAYQIQNDLEDWHADQKNKITRGQDVRAARPTILHAFALEAGAREELNRAGSLSDHAAVERVRVIYQETGSFARAEQLLEKLRARAVDAAGGIEAEPLRELFRFLVRAVLEPRDAP
jgi:geranylgeranyl pyrophosphate synthase